MPVKKKYKAPKKKRKRSVGNVVASKEVVIRTFPKGRVKHRSMDNISPNALLHKAASLIKEQIGKLETRKFVATTKTEKRKIAKEIAEAKSRYRRIVS